ncbi:MAG: hypothetical protein J6Y62_04595 [Clostridia bacterium]|nr:hypothetical protein [Clostridia bacterium]
MSKRKNEELEERPVCEIDQPDFDEAVSYAGQTRRARILLMEREGPEKVAAMTDREVMEKMKKYYFYVSGANTESVLLVRKEDWEEIKGKLVFLNR